MRFVFQSSDLERVYVTGTHPKWHPNLVKAFIRVVRTISQAPDERTLRGLKVLHMETLHGGRDGQYSVRVNDQYRLIYTIERDDDGNLLLIIDVVDYH